jgi:hypothetical protein
MIVGSQDYECSCLSAAAELQCDAGVDFLMMDLVWDEGQWFSVKG